MRFDIVTIFPAMIEQAVATGVVGRAIERGTLQLGVHDLRAFTSDRHRVVDDVPYGGGPGMVLKPEPMIRAIDAIAGAAAQRPRVLLTSPQGTRLTQPVVERLGREPHLVLLCGRYEGVDERVRPWVDEELSVGDYVLSGGELAALIVVDAVARLVPGVVGDGESVTADSFNRGLLDFPHYTRPATVAGPGGEELRVPDVLLSGNHAEIRRWRRREALRRTIERRPDLIGGAVLDDDEHRLLQELAGRPGGGDE